MKRIPITEAKRITEQFQVTGVIVIAFDMSNMQTQLTSYGETPRVCRALADVARQIDSMIKTGVLEPQNA